VCWRLPLEWNRWPTGISTKPCRHIRILWNL